MKPWASVIGGEDEKEKTKRIVIIKEISSHERDLIKTKPQNQVLAHNKLAPLSVAYLKKVEVDEGDYGVSNTPSLRVKKKVKVDECEFLTNLKIL